jgi:hypothetical protein
LEPAGLWTTRDEEEGALKKKKHPFEKEKDPVVEEKDSIIKETFGKEKVCITDIIDWGIDVVINGHCHSSYIKHEIHSTSSLPSSNNHTRIRITTTIASTFSQISKSTTISTHSAS